ncbi:MAG: nitrogenase component 1 [Peptostreptococcaceae bacterium]
MSLCRFLPNPSDRMAIIWSLLTVKDSIVLEYGPAGTTHYSVSFFGKLNVDKENRLFTTHMSEDDVIMGNTERLELAIKEIDETFAPKVIFVLASSVSAVIGTDIKGICMFMQDDVNAKLVGIEEGGFNGDYSLGQKNVYKYLVKAFTKEPTTKLEKHFNIIGASSWSYRIESDVNEICRMMKDNFDFDLYTSLCTKTSVDELTNMSSVRLNVVINNEGLEIAKYLEEKFGTPYIYMPLYGYKNTFAFLQEVSNTLNIPVVEEYFEGIQNKIAETSHYSMMKRMLRKNFKAFIFADYDHIVGLKGYLEQMGFEVDAVCKHSIKGIETDIKYLVSEKERVEILKSLSNTLIFADDVSNSLADDTNTKVRFTTPNIKGQSICTHLPFVGVNGADYIREFVEEYFSNLR